MGGGLKRGREKRGRGESQATGGGEGGSLERDPRDRSTTPRTNYPYPVYPSFQRYPSGSIMDIPQVPQIPLIPNYYPQPPQPPLPPLQAPPPTQLAPTTAHIQQAMLEYQRRWPNIHQ